MRIALLTYSTRPRGGVVHTLALAEALAARGHSVDVWTLGRGGDAGFYRPVATSVGVRAVPFPEVDGEQVGARILRSIAVLGAAFQAASADGCVYDVVHAQDCISANAVPRCLRTVHHLDTFTTPELVACHERAIVRPVGHVCVSRAVAEELRAGWGIEAMVIPNGIDAARFAAAGAPDRDASDRVASDQDAPGWDASDRDASDRGASDRDASGRDASGRDASGRNASDRYVLAVGGIEPRKGSADLVEAMARVQAVDPSLRLVVAGGETLFDYRDYRASVLDRAAALGVSLDLLGVVPDDELPAVVAGAAAFAFPSVKEGFGLAAMEALAAGVPVVMRDLPVLREVFGSAVRFASDVDGLAAGLLAAAGPRDPDRVREGRELAASYTWGAAAEAHEQFYAAILARA